MSLWWRRLAVVLCLLAAGLFRPSVVRDFPGDGQLLWTRDKAVLYVFSQRHGYRMNLLAWPVAFLFSWTYDRVSWPTTIFDLTPDGVVRHEFTNLGHRDLIGLGDYVTSGSARWTGERFEPHQEVVPDSYRDDAATGAGGWSRRSVSIPESGDRVIEFTLGGRPTRLRLSRDSGGVSVDLDRGNNRPIERLWTAITRLRWVSAAEYDTLMRDGRAWNE